ncbi:site-specific integrase [Opitutales bacterium]|nr:site-specific integrase [Opitutales bacterium]
MKSNNRTYEYPKGSGIKISLVLNGSKNTSNNSKELSSSFRATIPTRLTGGKRRIKQFKQEKEARVFAKEEWDFFRTQGDIYFDLSREEIRQAFNAMQLAKENEADLLKVVKFGIERMYPEGGSKTVKETVDEFVAIKEKRHEKGDLALKSLRDIRSKAKKISLLLGKKPIKEVSGKQLKKALTGLNKTHRTQKNYKSLWSEVFKFAKENKYIIDNPFDELSTEDKKEIIGRGNDWNPPEILTIEEANLLLHTALANPELNLLAAVTLGLFCGIRTEEIKKLKWENVKLNEDNPHVNIPLEIAKKRRLRQVEISPNAVKWLMQCPKRSGKITENNHENDYQKRFRTLHLKCGISEKIDGKIVSHWKQNAMRHSFGTYHCALHENPIKTSNELGHKSGDDVLYTHYRSLATKAEGRAFFNIRPVINKEKLLNFA